MVNLQVIYRLSHCNSGGVRQAFDGLVRKSDSCYITISQKSKQLVFPDAKILVIIYRKPMEGL